MLPPLPLKRSENQSFSDLFKWYEKVTLGRNELKYIGLHKLNLFVQITFNVWKFYLSS